MKAKHILWAGLLVGTLDILAASLDFYISTGKGPEGVLRYIASGVFGMDAFKANPTMPGWGLFFHYVIALSLTFFFFWAYNKMNWMQHNLIVTAIVFGLFSWIVTALVIVPLSNTPPLPYELWKMVKAVVILVTMIGFPLTWLARKYSTY